MKDSRFPKSSLLEIKWIGLPPKLNYGGKQKRDWKPFYTRSANVGQIYINPFRISWRLPYHPNFAYSEGWDACWRQHHGIIEKEGFL